MYSANIYFFKNNCFTIYPQKKVYLRRDSNKLNYSCFNFTVIIFSNKNIILHKIVIVFFVLLFLKYKNRKTIYYYVMNAYGRLKLQSFCCCFYTAFMFIETMYLFFLSGY